MIADDAQGVKRPHHIVTRRAAAGIGMYQALISAQRLLKKISEISNVLSSGRQGSRTEQSARSCGYSTPTCNF